VKVKELGEDALVRRLAEILGSTEIGDDAAPVRLGEKVLLLTCDALREGTHFLDFFPPEAVGWKAVSVNVSDCTANAGKPLWLLVDLALPPEKEVSYAEALYRGIKEACEAYGCKVVGGNAGADEKVGLSLFLVGETERFVGRKGARPGEALFVSGTLGDARAGLELLLMRKESYEPFEEKLIERHLRPRARTDYREHLLKRASASMDVSDGLLADARRLAERSEVALHVESRLLPLSEELLAFCEKYGKDPLTYALSGGEDYQLLFTHAEELVDPSLDMTQIGTVKEGRGLYVDGKEAPEGGFKHF